MARSTKTEMEQLHSLICKQLTKLIETGTWVNPKSEAVEPLPASYFMAAISFLNQNDIKGLPVEGSPLSNLMKGIDLSSIKADIQSRRQGH